MDSKLKRKWSTTEIAMTRLKYLGLDRANSSVQKACLYCETLLNDLSLWPEGMEKNQLFPRAVPVYITTVLSHFGSEDLLYQQYKNALLSLLNEAFKDGTYNQEALVQRAKKTLGIEIHGTYIGLNSKYLLVFFHHHEKQIDKEIQKKYLKWLHEQDRIFYSAESLKTTITPLSDLGMICRKVELLSYLSSLYGFSEEFIEDLNALSVMRQSDGCWDFGNGFRCPRLSENWGNSANRKFDQTFYIQRLFHNPH